MFFINIKFSLSSYMIPFVHFFKLFCLASTIKNYACIFLLRVFNEHFVRIFFFSALEFVLRYSDKSVVIMTIYLILKTEPQKNKNFAET